jgi:hypothetical protein
MDNSTKKRGGQREGAGRKPSVERNQLISVKVTKAAKDIYDLQANKAEFIDEAIKEKHKRALRKK